MKHRLVCAWILSSIIIFLTGCSSISESTDTAETREALYKTSDENAEMVQADFSEANLNFAVDIFRELETEDTDNIFISPISISIALSMTLNGAGNETFEQMRDVLGYSGFTMDDVNENFTRLISSLENADDSVLLNLSNSVWVKEGFPVETAFTSTLVDAFDSDVEFLDFSLAEAPDIINAWIAESTNNLIPSMISFIPPDAVMYLINAIYFKGDWLYLFNEEDTVSGEFTFKDTVSTVDFMTRQGSTEGYYKGETCSAVRLGYGRDKIAFYAVLPDEKTPDDFSEILSSGQLDNIFNSMSTREVEVRLPKFKMTYGIKNLNDALQGMGMLLPFSADADFSKMAENRDLMISRVLHKAMIEVNEQGSEAAAVTVVEMVETAIDPLIFSADRPFLFFIRDDRSGTILFMGKFTGPEA